RQFASDYQAADRQMEFPAGIFPLCDSLPQGIVGTRWHRVSTMRQPARPHPPTISTSYHPLRDMSLTKLLIFVPPRLVPRYQYSSHVALTNAGWTPTNM